MIEEQECRKCGLIKTIDNFGKDKTMKYGYKIYCRECRAKESKLYSEINSEKIKKYKETTKEYRKSKWKDYYDQPHVQDRLKQYRRSDKNKEIQKRYSLENKDSISVKNRRRNAKKKNLLHPLHDIDIEKQMFEDCVRLAKETGYKWSVDHIYPLSKGGPHWHLNLQVIPHKFNLQKNDNLEYENDYLIHWSKLPKEVLDWIDQKNFVDKPRSLDILGLCSE